ncbi:adenosylcobinamide-phosphate synthase CbiB [Paenochrobactrum glaciei]|uniref:Cobalamin biosynthesis protein CobD n=1 Tax=Paenochrobactrum glaciei TaxID=486407 RepID=A0ABN1FZX9_9HYPH
MELKLIILFFAVFLDRIIGDPAWMWARVPHPVMLFGKLISFFEKRLNHKGISPQRLRLRGTFSFIFLMLLVGALAFGVQLFLRETGLAGAVVEALIVMVFLAQKSLADHVQAVATGLREGGLAKGRYAVSMIVGRDPEGLDEGGVSRAAIESLAENASDGVVAPVFWYLVLGLPGLLVYKLVNTADSMIGHMNERYLYYGWFAARFDDLVNLIPARLTGFLTVIAVLVTRGLSQAKKCWHVMWRDAGSHRSPNAGWPESAFAAALGLALAGPRHYYGKLVASPTLNEGGRREANADDIAAAVTLFWHTMTVMGIAIGVAALVAWLV